MVKKVEKVTYICEICGKKYESSREALVCEGQEPKKKFEWNIGDKVYTINANSYSEMGVIVGATTKKHDYIPQIKIQENFVFMYGEYEEIM